MNLSTIFQAPQLVSLLSESDTAIVLSLQDPQTGEVRRVEISADMAVLPDEAILSVAVRDERDEVNLREWWAKGDISSDNGMFPETTEADLLPTWIVTPNGEHVDLRAREGSLF